MAVHDPISDFLTILKNAGRARQQAVECKGSHLIQRLAELLRDEGYLANVKVIKERPQRVLKVSFKYDAQQKSIIRNLRRVSKPSRRVYVGHKEVKRVLGGLGIAIVSTSQGLLTDRQARKAGLGGEILCEVW